jgi:hypothetical protein
MTVEESSTAIHTTLARAKSVKINQQARERAMNKECLEAKFDLCIDQAEKNIKEEEIALAIANLRRANSALSQLFGFEEEENE